MERLAWTSAELKSNFETCKTLTDIIQAIEQQVWRVKKVITGVHLNGKLLSDVQEVESGTKQVNEIQQLAVDVESLESVTKNVITSQGKVASDIEMLSLEAAEFFRLSDLSRGLERLKQIITLCEIWNDTLYSLLKTPVEFTQDKQRVADCKELELQQREVTLEILDALSRKDFLLIADLLEYELTTLFQRWSDVLEISRTVIK